MLKLNHPRVSFLQSQGQYPPAGPAAPTFSWEEHAKPAWDLGDFLRLSGPHDENT